MTSGIKCTFEKQETVQLWCRFIRGRRLGGDGGGKVDWHIARRASRETPRSSTKNERLVAPSRHGKGRGDEMVP